MSAGSAERNFLSAISPEPLHIASVREKTTTALLVFITTGRKVAA
jgi:hypothetical protein